VHCEYVVYLPNHTYNIKPQTLLSWLSDIIGFLQIKFYCECNFRVTNNKRQIVKSLIQSQFVSYIKHHNPISLVGCWRLPGKCTT